MNDTILYIIVSHNYQVVTICTIQVLYGSYETHKALHIKTNSLFSENSVIIPHSQLEEHSSCISKKLIIMKN